MLHPDALRLHFGDAVAGATTPLDAANRLCHACVTLLEVDGASISLMHEGSTRGTFGSSSPVSRRLDEFQFTYGEGPCLDAVRDGGPVLVADLDDPAEQRWPAFREAVLGAGVCAIFALPVAVAFAHVGALDLYNNRAGRLTDQALAGAVYAAELAALPLLDLMTAHVDWEGIAQGEDPWGQLTSLERVEVYQATGMIMAALDATPAEALARLRGLAYARGLTASEVAWAIVERRVSIVPDGSLEENL
ncbi:MAG: hypothetical protein QOF39_2091 [Frankiales bacterium]|nr:hypothetical protein [Frankiales bacterium]